MEYSPVWTMLGLALRRPDVATLACVANNGRVGSLGDNGLLTVSICARDRTMTLHRKRTANSDG
jgi:hypothetical protein